MSKLALSLVILMACSSDPRTRRYEHAVANLSIYEASTLVHLCCPPPYNPHERVIGYGPACISLNAELLASRDFLVVERLLDGPWTAECRQQIPPDTLIVLLARTPDDEEEVRTHAVSKLSRYTPSPRIITALVRELERPGVRPIGNSIATTSLSALGEVDFVMVTDALLRASPVLRDQLFLVLYMATDHPLEMPALERMLGRIAAESPDPVRRGGVTLALDRYRRALAEPREHAITKRLAGDDRMLRILGRRRFACGDPRVSARLEKLAADPWRYQEQELAQELLDNRARYCAGTITDPSNQPHDRSKAAP